jgi:glycosyltransferase 2 family protein
LTAPSPAPPSGRRWTRWLVRLVGVALLVVVVRNIDWRDVVVLADGTKQRGEIVGEAPSRAEWDAGANVVFEPVDEAPRTYAARDLEKDKLGAPKLDEGIVRIVRRSDKTLLALGLLAYGLITQFGVLRWWVLLRAQDIRISYLLALRLTFLGFFFNNVVPGPTGGDVVKAVYAVRRTPGDKRAQAVVTVVIDRVVGILALALIAAVVLVAKLDDPHYRELAAAIGLFLAGFAVASVLFFSRRIRRLLRFEKWTARLPAAAFLRKADEAVFLWRGHKRAVVAALLLSFANQLSIQGMMMLFGSALHMTTQAGDPVHWTTYMAVLPVAFIGSALPLLPGGWGFREALFAVCFGLVGVDRNPAVALSVLNGMTQLAWSLLGGVFFLLDRPERRPPTDERVGKGRDQPLVVC